MSAGRGPETTRLKNALEALITLGNNKLSPETVKQLQEKKEVPTLNAEGKLPRERQSSKPTQE